MPPKELTFLQIRDILSRGAFSELLNCFENEHVDFKSEPYRLDDEAQKLELAKDISALANTMGGFIVLGVRTSKIPEYSADVADQLRPIPRNLFNQERYESIARDWIYPPCNGLQIAFVESHDDPGKGFAILEIPASTPTSKPYLIVRASEDNKGRNNESRLAMRSGAVRADGVLLNELTKEREWLQKFP
jgi:predicted HTH transcriptional regulator